MRSGWVFFKKEVLTIARTYRVWLVPVIFVFFGILSPVTAKFTPAIVKTALQSDPAQKQIFGQLKIPDPTVADAYAQWFKNLSQFGILALILLSMGLVADEKSSGTLALVTVKPVSRPAIVISKFVAHAGLIAVSMAIGAFVCYLYTVLLFDKANAYSLFASTLAFGIFALLLFSLTLFFSVLMKKQMGAGGLALIATLVLTIVPSLGHGLEKYTPGALTTAAAKVAGGEGLHTWWPAIAITLGASIVVLIAACWTFERQEI